MAWIMPTMSGMSASIRARKSDACLVLFGSEFFVFICVWSLGCGMWGVACGVWGVGFWVLGLGFWVWGLGFRV